VAKPPPARRRLIASLAVTVALLAMAAPARADSPSPSPSQSVSPVRSPKLTAAAAVLEDFDTGQVLYSRSATVRRPIASITKIMTAIVVLSSSNLDDIVAVPSAAVAQPGSTLGLRTGERLTVRDLIYGMLMTSANDAAVALAYHVGGTVPAFVRMMNATAARIGLRDTHLASPTGLDDAGYSTAGDLARLTQRAYANPTFAQLVATLGKRIPGPGGTTRRLVNGNILLRVYPGAFGVKSGFTTAAGHCLVGATRLNGFGLLAVVLGSTNAFDDTIHLLNYGFGAFERVLLLKAGDQVGRVTIQGTPVDAVAGRDVPAVVRKGQPPSVERRLVPDQGVTGPVAAGGRVGRVEVFLSGRLVRTVPALAAPVTPAPSSSPPGPPLGGVGRLNVVERAILFLAALIRAALNAFL
jgi:serine-type D-Ala-D-Ala carboxypeptidase (penicillin-binding protein 5/6)